VTPVTKLGERINRVVTNELFPNCVLVSQMTHENQINLVDLRADGEVAVTLSWTMNEGKFPGTIYTPSWHPAGRLVCFGTQGQSVNIWDLRYASKTGLAVPSQTLPMHLQRVYRAEWHPTRHNWLTSISADRTLGFHTFTLTQSS
jgi:WD40 repeat protein